MLPLIFPTGVLQPSGVQEVQEGGPRGVPEGSQRDPRRGPRRSQRGPRGVPGQRGGPESLRTNEGVFCCYLQQK